MDRSRNACVRYKQHELGWEVLMPSLSRINNLQKHAARCLDSLSIDPSHLRRTEHRDDAADIIGFPGPVQLSLTGDFSDYCIELKRM